MSYDLYGVDEGYYGGMYIPELYIEPQRASQGLTTFHYSENSARSVDYNMCYYRLFNNVLNVIDNGRFTAYKVDNAEYQRLVNACERYRKRAFQE